jgi:nucleotide-binding universal stress UspA family protein
MVIMATVSSSGLKIGKMIGSVSDHVCRTVPVPVMLIRPKYAEAIKGKAQLINHLMVNLDGSELSKMALPVATELAALLKVKVTLFQMARMIRVLNAGSELGAPDTFIDYTSIDKVEKERVTGEMIDLDIELRKKGLDIDYVVTLGFDAAEDIIETSQKTGADLMVMSTHGRSGIGRFVFGSVAEKILRHGEIPLLLINARAS